MLKKIFFLFLSLIPNYPSALLSTPFLDFTRAEKKKLEQAFYRAVEKGEENDARKCFSCIDRACLYTIFRTGKTLLHKAGSYAVAAFLLEQGISVNEQDEHGDTALHNAPRREIAQLLLARNANSYARNQKGHVPLHTAALADRSDVLEELLHTNDIDYKNIQDDEGKTALALAAASGFVQAAHLLLQDDANCNLTDASGKIPLHWAALAHAPKVIDLLLASGAAINALDRTGNTPIWYGKKHKETIHILAAHKANLSFIYEGMTLLHWAVKHEAPLFYRQPDVLPPLTCLLLDYGADREAIDSKERTPYQLAEDLGQNGAIKDVLVNYQPIPVPAL